MNNCIKLLTTTILLMTAFSAKAQHGKASTEKKTFSRTTEITQNISAEPAVIWELLTNAENMTSWNTTIVSLEGVIQKGEKIQLVSKLDPSRTFKLKVKEMVENETLVWGDAMGERHYHLKKTDHGTQFGMSEKIGGLMFPLFANQIPSFDASFEQFTADLKKAAEAK